MGTRAGVIILLSLIALQVAPYLPADGAAHAAGTDSVTWTVQPADSEGADGRSRVEHQLDPGESVHEYLSVRNLSERDVVFSLGAADGYFTKAGRFNMLTADQTSVDAGLWVDVQASITVPAGEEAVVPYTVAVPATAEPGDHLAGIAASIRSTGNANLGIESRVGFRVMIRVAGELDPAATTSSSAEYFGSLNPLSTGAMSVSYQATNTGNARLHITLNVTARALFGLVALQLPTQEIEDLGIGQTQKGTISIPNVWPLLLYDVETKTVATDVVNGGERFTLTSGSTALAMPWPQLASIALSIVTVYCAALLYRRARRRRADLIEATRQEGIEIGRGVASRSANVLSRSAYSSIDQRQDDRGEESQ